MNTLQWAFLNPEHPVYDRPPDASRWTFGLPQFRAAEYEGDGLTSEPLIETMVDHPSVNVYQGAAMSTVQQVDLRSPQAQDIDLVEVQAQANRWLQALKAMSQGPYGRDMLAKMGNPYGYGEKTQYVNRGSYVADVAPSWAKLLKPRKLPSMGPFAYIRGVKFRGRVSDKSIVNIDSGTFLRSWSLAVTRWFGGVTFRFINRAPWSWFLFHGTIHMQAHGPWGTVAERVLPALQSAWFWAGRNAWLRRKSSESITGPGNDEARQASFEQGGWA